MGKKSKRKNGEKKSKRKGGQKWRLGKKKRKKRKKKKKDTGGVEIKGRDKGVAILNFEWVGGENLMESRGKSTHSRCGICAKC